VDFAVEVELNSLLRFAGAEEPESGGGKGKEGSDAADNLGPAL
jgi:hypothetical protein